jgi:pyruvate formate lyase activating enzyme
LDKVKDYKAYFGKRGGVTISGGDPVFQPKFLLQFVKLCKKEKINVTVDSSFMTTKDVIDKLYPYVDTFMVSLKHFDNATHRCLTGVPNTLILENIRYLAKKIGKKGQKHKTKLWLRYVVIPGYTDTRKNLKALVAFLHEIKHFELLDLLPYHTYGIYKWKKLGLKYALEGVKPPPPKKVAKIKKMLEDEGFKVLLNT